MKGYFIAGTDTGVGKTCVSAALIRGLAAAGKQVAGMKPVASGCEKTVDGLRNEDALLLMAAANVEKPYPMVNPFAFEPAIAPHLAADLAGIQIDSGNIHSVFTACCEDLDNIIVEGVGGWLVPINARESMADLAVLLNLPVLLVVGIRLGCISHTLLTVAAIEASGLPLAGWIANRVDSECQQQEGIIASIKKRIDAPLIADIPWCLDVATMPALVLP
ncbi:MAG: dethiobiotin synthase [Gammaproteobacteria bacterium]